ncbi:MAG: hypothetical protein ACI39U_02775, partial [Candidatus Cryptobacteroides sp.]
MFSVLTVLFSCAYMLPAQVKTGHPEIVSAKISSPDRVSSVTALLKGRTDSQKLALADSLWEEYSFRSASRVCDDIIKTSKDSLIKVYASELKEYCLNGIDYSETVGLPVVIARERFSKQDFFLYYPLGDRSWKKTSGSGWVYFPDDEKSFFHSSVPDSTGCHIVCSELSDSLTWSVSAPLFSGDSYADEIMPMLSADRKSLTFSARRGDGVGGYDLYESVWNDLDSCWTAPVNMGFPYSSPANDYLLVNTSDGRYTFFASDRDCPKDSLFVYVLEYEFVPAQENVGDASALKKIMALDPDDRRQESEMSSAIPENTQTQDYMRKMEDVRILRARLDSAVTRLEQMRETYAMSDEVEQRQELTTQILTLEASLPS